MTQWFRYRFRVRYSEVDPQSVVFNSRYLEYADVVITEFWRARAIHFSGAGALEFHVARAEVDFVAPIRADEIVEGRARTERLGNTSIATIIELHGAASLEPLVPRDEVETPDAQLPEDLRARIRLVHVHVDLESGRPMPLPGHVRERLGAPATADAAERARSCTLAASELARDMVGTRHDQDAT